jgi:Zn-dependent oligopeptidase
MNITEAKTNRPTLLQHQQLCSLFNYFGLAVHNLVSCQQYGRFFQGAEEDFIEIPGALLEQFCWETKILECVGQHWSWNSEFSEIWARNQSNITSNADKPSETLDRDTIRQLQAWKANNEGLEKLKECQHTMFDMGYHRPEDPHNIPHSVIWSKEMTDRVSPFSIKAMEEIEDVWEWGQCSPKLDGLRMRYMGRQTKLL